MIKKFYSGNAPELEKYEKMCLDEGAIDPSLYTKYSVNRGLRDLNGKGVLTGLTEISEIQSKKNVDGVEVPAEGMLFYRGYNVKDIIADMASRGRYGFEETIYILLFGKLPDELSRLFDIVRIRQLGQKLGFEKIIIKNGVIIAFFISNPLSQYYKSDRFSKILENITLNPKLFELKQNDNRLRIFIRNIDSLSKAYETLMKL